MVTGAAREEAFQGLDCPGISDLAQGPHGTIAEREAMVWRLSQGDQSQEPLTGEVCLRASAHAFHLGVDDHFDDDDSGAEQRGGTGGNQEEVVSP